MQFLKSLIFVTNRFTCVPTTLELRIQTGSTSPRAHMIEVHLCESCPHARSKHRYATRIGPDPSDPREAYIEHAKCGRKRPAKRTDQGYTLPPKPGCTARPELLLPQSAPIDLQSTSGDFAPIDLRLRSCEPVKSLKRQDGVTKAEAWLRRPLDGPFRSPGANSPHPSISL